MALEPVTSVSVHPAVPHLMLALERYVAGARRLAFGTLALVDIRVLREIVALLAFDLQIAPETIHRANAVVAEAEQYAAHLRSEADAYAFDVLHDLEAQLALLATPVKNALRTLESSTVSDSVTDTRSVAIRQP